ncbi:TIGR00730 family Rossman fold protein [Cryobacterium algoritolerans]|uniref:Cytokinin riboside 5'-monophosphate phosphoribohydrolase n=1 Tax=Cryobacterium algoritolerans TaxID=1259184 RepID=A0A4R8WS99_9MICO|nr:TIGR00730 family Rossman fold protein [Cryobacterium algoritolerans]TFC14709.1 TIGR00730 family Rossman fold protein [Cryobacterium algoritolerans]
MRVAIFTGSAAGNKTVFTEHAAALAGSLADQGIGIVYGGGNVGLMGVIGSEALSRGGEVLGVMPASLVERELAHPSLTRLEIVQSMHERKARMAELSDAFIALPGGTGMLGEFFEVWTWQQLGIHEKPVALYSIDGFWDPLIAAIDASVEAGFMRPAYRDVLIISDDAQDLLTQLRNWNPAPHKWTGPSEAAVIPLP